MGADDPLDTQRYPPSPATELADVGFDAPEEIGRGGFGAVYRCTQADLDRTVAVKVLLVDLDEDDRARFFREQRAMGRLTGHPNIVNILQVGATDSGRPYIVMPYHPQDSLDARIRRDGPLPLDYVLRLGVKMAGAVESAHRLSILHRDVKPANILLTDYGEPELTDFGIAHVSGGFETSAGTVTGSPAYTAPEILGGDPPSPMTDVYGLGASLFSALTGHAAFERRSGEQIVAQFLRITTQSVPDLRVRGMADDVSAVIARAMSRAPDQRPATAADFGEELRQLQSDHGLPIDEMALRPAHNADVSAEGRNPGAASRRRRRFTAPFIAPGSAGSLPLELTSFIGRRHELTRTKNLLNGSRLVTLTGIGGVGKTRLALQVAANVQRNYADGARLVELGELRDESLLVEAVAGALGVQDRSAKSLREVLLEFLATRQLLLLLDNCEQVVSAAAELSDVLLHVCPRLRILATSREPLDIGGEVVFQVPPLGVPDPERTLTSRGMPKYDAITLFADRAAAAVPGFELTDENAETVAEICHRLDGLPLPIELAAARLRAMSSEQILSRLTDRFTLLTRSSRGTPTRQQTLRLSIDWSFALCTAREQLVWGRVAVFAGSFELDAAEQVCGADLHPNELLDTLTSLVEKSILIRDKHGSVVRLRMLETIRAYGREKIEFTGDYLSLRRRHQEWCEGLVLDAEVDWISARQLDWIDRLKREQPNIREALAFSVFDSPDIGLRVVGALFLFWSSQGLYSEGRLWLDRLMPRQTGPPTLEWIKALYCASMLANVQGDLQAGAALVAQGRTLTSQTGDPRMHALIEHAEGIFALYSGDPAKACAHLKSPLSVPDFQEGLTLRTDALYLLGVYLLGVAYGLRGETELAVECHERVLSITETCGEVMYRSYSLWSMGVIVWQQGDSGRASKLLEQALPLTRQVHNPRITSLCIEVLAWIASQTHKKRRAAILLGCAEELSASVGSGTAAFPGMIAHHEECHQITRRSLGDKEFEARRRDGQRLGFDAAIAYALGEGTSTPTAHASVRLTNRERQVAELVAEGMTNKSIAGKLVISVRTAQGHVEHILTKLGLTSRVQIAAWVAEGTHE
ncbi:non-specific serine/threonine protein kinase [Rhodococcus erythropolis]|uniref:protein kinase domain-containing protein n=1 Tax=Rhodococcus erythropolis TaxID=1833 RepID=UPI002168F13A|nr:protein kinase [Rhodococcus erythropolis]MCS4253047.1 non-specific serine/threonine protein kinase [Rhodococcus erythropolis]MCW2428508.1 non-specific serine/threonine protein kinase [Rhodococcus erythropolis]